MLSRLKVKFKSDPSLFFLFLLFFNALILSTCGQVQGLLLPFAVFFGGLISLGLIYLLFDFSKNLYCEKSNTLFYSWIIALFFNSLWVVLKAPLDIDGLFYHLTIILHALQNNQWNSNPLLLWHIQSAPKLGVLSSLSIAAFFGDYGYRFISFGHFTSGLIGAYAWIKCAHILKIYRPFTFGLMFLMTPLVIKQMGSQYVDLALYSYWFMMIALLLEVYQLGSGFFEKKMILFLGAGACAYMMCSIKLNGIALVLSATPFMYFFIQKFSKKIIPFFFIPICLSG